MREPRPGKHYKVFPCCNYYIHFRTNNRDKVDKENQPLARASLLHFNKNVFPSWKRSCRHSEEGQTCILLHVGLCIRPPNSHTQPQPEEGPAPICILLSATAFFFRPSSGGTYKSCHLKEADRPFGLSGNMRGVGESTSFPSSIYRMLFE